MQRVAIRGTFLAYLVNTPNNLQIGHQHGTAAKAHIARCISFYASLFEKNCKRSWPQVLELAEQFEQTAKEKWLAYHEEMRGIADGAGVKLLDIVALNVRTEINFGMFDDGCTSLAWHTDEHAYLGQNWDVGIATVGDGGARVTDYV